MDVTAIFDIGKTNKKFFLFDAAFREVYRTYSRFEETKDDDGEPCDDLELLTAWMKQTFQEALADPRFNIKRLNFSTYGASFVHLDEQGKPVAPLYNYLKAMPERITDRFMQAYGPADEWQTQTASPFMGMLNSGLQLYWLKYSKPEVFAKIHRSLHFPQYCANIFSGTAQTEYTSIGCHTGLWHYERQDYHPWVYAEGLDRLLPPIRPATTAQSITIEGKEIQVGTGIHDSSAALLPYILADSEPFLLLSTGTWSIAFNAFSTQNLSGSDLAADCLNFLRVDGRTVRAARLFLGNEYKIWSLKLADHFNRPYEDHRTVAFDATIHQQLKKLDSPVFRWESIAAPGSSDKFPEKTDLHVFDSYEMAFHQLVRELVELQVISLRRAKGHSNIRKLYIDGGFADNQIFLQYLSMGLPEYTIITITSPLGSALGAAMAIHNRPLNPELIMDHFSPQQQKQLKP
ncbi:MAG: hypothetical protein KI786_04380 [Mameliella sp.]|nr:hypothetical protein [Phaeodactylibacter sp.]